MSTQTLIESKVTAKLAPEYLEVINESKNHNVPKNSETHFKLVVVAQAFENQNRVARHRQINQLLAEELANGVHALSLQLFTPAEWQAKGGEVIASPRCMGGSKHDAI